MDDGGEHRLGPSVIDIIYYKQAINGKVNKFCNFFSPKLLLTYFLIQPNIKCFSSSEKISLQFCNCLLLSISSISLSSSSNDFTALMSSVIGDGQCGSKKLF